MPFTISDIRVFVYNTLIGDARMPTAAEIAAHFAVSRDDVIAAVRNARIGKTLLPDPRTGVMWTDDEPPERCFSGLVLPEPAASPARFPVAPVYRSRPVRSIVDLLSNNKTANRSRIRGLANTSGRLAYRFRASVTRSGA